MGTLAYRHGMRGKVLNLFLDEAQLLDDRALTFIVSQNDPLGVSRKVLESLDSLESIPLVIGYSDVRAVVELSPGRSGTSIVMVPSPSGKDRPVVSKLPHDLDGGHVSEQATLGGKRAKVGSHPKAPLPPMPRKPVPPVKPSIPVQTPPPKVTSPVKAMEAECSVEVLMDITGNSTCSGCISDFARYFQDRFSRLKRLISNRREMMGSVPVAAVRNRAGDVKTIGIVVERQSTNKGGVIFELEDASGRIKVLSSGKKKAPVDIVTDEVVGVIGTMNASRDLVYLDQLVRPEVPVHRRTHMTDRDLRVAFAGDIHVGSNTFLDTEWNRFMDFLNGRLNMDNGTNGLLDSLEVLVIPGDVVDGIGIYPNQQKELLISDIYRQYEALAELLKDIPDHIEVILSPGNHDAVRLAEPQPALPDDIQELFSGKIRFHGNPALIDIEGVKILSYHGKSIDDYVQHVQRCTYEDPVTVMKEMLKRRHLAPIYGGRTSIAPEAMDHLVIETIPDIFVTGHVHGTGVAEHRNSLLINASAWQSQTDYQKQMNFVPDPAKVPVVNLKDMSVKVLDFGG
jgi:DNA polymerase II small subunit